MLQSQLLITLCGLGAIQFASADSDIPSFSLVASPQAAKPSAYRFQRHQAMGDDCKHKQKQKNGASGLPKIKARPTTFATLARSNLVAAQAVQNNTASGVINQATVVVVTQTVVPVAASSQNAASVVVMSPAAVASVAAVNASPSVAAVTMSPAPAVEKAASPSQSRLRKAASSVVAAPAASAGVAAPVASPAAASASVAASTSGGLTAEQVVAVMPSSGSCSSSSPAGECLTAAQAAPLLTQSFTKYGINNKGAQAAILALIGLESGDLKYNQHYTNGAPAKTGQGTYNEMSPSFVLEYAKALGIASSDALTAMNSINKNPGDSIASAAWFLKTKCPAVIAQFASSPDAAYSAYLGSGCIGTTQTAERTAYFTRAKAALGA